MALLIRNGEIVTVGSRVQADIYVENETITRIGNLQVKGSVSGKNCYAPLLPRARRAWAKEPDAPDPQHSAQAAARGKTAFSAGLLADDAERSGT